MPKYTQHDIERTYNFYQNIGSNQEKDFNIYSKDFNYMIKHFNESLDGVQQSNENGIDASIAKNRLIATYLYFAITGTKDFYRKARRLAREEEGSFLGLTEAEKIKAINKQYKKVKKSEQYEKYLALLVDYKAKVMKATGITNEQIDVLLHDVEANHSGFVNLYEIAENGDKTYEKVDYKEEQGIKGKVKKIVGKDTEYKETTYINRSYNEPQEEVDYGMPIKIVDIKISEKDIEETNLDERIDTYDPFGELEQRNYYTTEPEEKKEEVVEEAIETDKQQIEVDLDEVEEALNPKIEGKKEEVKEDLKHKKEVKEKEVKEAPKIDKQQIEVDLEKEEKKPKGIGYIKTNNGFFVPINYMEHWKNARSNVEIIYSHVSRNSNQELLKDFYETFGMNDKVTPEELKANEDLSKAENVFDKEQAKLNNECVRKQKGSLLTVNNVNRGLAIYKAQKERYTSKNGLVRFFTYFSKENRELRNNYKKMEKVFMDAGIPKNRLDDVMKDTDNAGRLIDDLAKNLRLVKESSFKDIYSDEFMAKYNEKFINAKANEFTFIDENGNPVNEDELNFFPQKGNNKDKSKKVEEKEIDFDKINSEELENKIEDFVK